MVAEGKPTGGPLQIEFNRCIVSGEGVPNGELRPVLCGSGFMGLLFDPMLAAMVIGLRPTDAGEASITLVKPPFELLLILNGRVGVDNCRDIDTTGK